MDIDQTGMKPEEEIISLANKVLSVYGKAEAPVLDSEIRRMAKLLQIPIEEVLGHG